MNANSTPYQPQSMNAEEAELFLPLAEAMAQQPTGENAARYAETLSALGRRDEAMEKLRVIVQQNPRDGAVRGALFHLECGAVPIFASVTAHMPTLLVEIYGAPLLQPAMHVNLAEQMVRIPNLNRTLGAIANAMVENGYPNLHALDLGSYIGSSVAEINNTHEISCLSVDCWPRHHALTRHNLPFIRGEHIAVMAAIGRDGEVLNILLPNRYTDADHIFLSTAPPDAENRLIDTVPTVAMSTLLRQYPAFAHFKLLKLDLEGNEAGVILSAADILQRNHPVIFWEYNNEYAADLRKAHLETRQSFELLKSLGYQKHLFYASSGELMAVVNADQSEQLNSLSAFLLSSRRGWPVPYCDICSLHQDDMRLLQPILQKTISPEVFAAVYG